MWWIAAGIAGAVAVALGAFGAHGLEDNVSEQALGWWRTGAQYHLVHAVALLGVAAHPRKPIAAGVLFLAGILFFSGSLYTMTLTDLRFLGAITPIGGVSFIAGWITLAAWPRTPKPEARSSDPD